MDDLTKFIEAITEAITESKKSDRIIKMSTEFAETMVEILIDQEWRNARDEQPVKPGWYWVYAPTYVGGSSTHRENHDGFMFAKWSGKAWSIERCYYNRPGCVEYWKPLPKRPKEDA